jgi:hypothetical protein
MSPSAGSYEVACIKKRDAAFLACAKGLTDALMDCQAKDPTGGPAFNRCAARANQAHDTCIKKASDEYGECLLRGEKKENKDRGKQLKKQNDGLKKATKKAESTAQKAAKKVPLVKSALDWVGSACSVGALKAKGKVKAALLACSAITNLAGASADVFKETVTNVPPDGGDQDRRRARNLAQQRAAAPSAGPPEPLLSGYFKEVLLDAVGDAVQFSREWAAAGAAQRRLEALVVAEVDIGAYIDAVGEAAAARASWGRAGYQLEELIAQLQRANGYWPLLRTHLAQDGSTGDANAALREVRRVWQELRAQWFNELRLTAAEAAFLDKAVRDQLKQPAAGKLAQGDLFAPEFLASLRQLGAELVKVQAAADAVTPFP